MANCAQLKCWNLEDTFPCCSSSLQEHCALLFYSPRTGNDRLLLPLPLAPRPPVAVLAYLDYRHRNRRSRLCVLTVVLVDVVSFYFSFLDKQAPFKQEQAALLWMDYAYLYVWAWNRMKEEELHTQRRKNGVFTSGDRAPTDFLLYTV